MRVEEKLNEYLEKVAGENITRVRSGKFNISGLGGCYRKQYYDRINLRKTPLTLDTRKVFKMGDIVHEFLQSLYPLSECEVKCETDHYVGYADIVTDFEVIDIKSVNSNAWNFIKAKKGEDFSTHRARVLKEKIHNVYQVVYYAHLIGKEKAWLCFVNKNTMECIEVMVLVKDYIDDIMKEVATLERFWNDEEVPAAEPKLFKGKECAYCSFLKTCKYPED